MSNQTCQSCNRQGAYQNCFFCSTGDHSEPLKPLYAEPSPACALGLQKLNEDILARYPTVQLIAYLGNHADPFICYLLIRVSDEEKTVEGHLASNIENHLRTLVETYIILHKASSAIASMHKGSRFWNEALSNSQVIFRSDDLPSFETQMVTDKVRLERAQFHWNLWGKQGEQLLKGAVFFYEGGNYRQAAFLLHKSTETMLKGIIQAVLGYRIQMHNIARLLRLTRLFTDRLMGVFDLESKAGRDEFAFLKSAYAQAHYSDSFAPDKETLLALVSKVERLNQEAQLVYHSFTQLLSSS